MHALLASFYNGQEPTPQVQQQQPSQTVQQPHQWKQQPKPYLKQRYIDFFQNSQSVDVNLTPQQNITTNQLDPIQNLNQFKTKKKGGFPFKKKLQDPIPPPVNIVNTVAEQSKKIKKKPGSEWNDKCQLIDVDHPKQIKDEKMTKRYQIHVKFKNQDGNIRNKTIRFGKKTAKEFIDHKDREMANFQLNKLKNWDNPLQPNYWRILLLNGEQNVTDSYKKYIQNKNLD